MSVAAGGVLSGEHGIGLEKRDLHAADVLARSTSTPRRRCARRSIPTALANPGKVLPSPAALRRPAAVAGRRVGLTARGSRRRSPTRSATERPGHDHRARRRAAVRSPACASCGAPAGIDWIAAGGDDGVAAAPARRSPSSTTRWPAHGQCVAIPPAGTVGGALAVGPQRDPPARLRAGPRRGAAGALRVGGGRGRQGRRADGEERQRVRPVPPARRLAAARSASSAR